MSFHRRASVLGQKAARAVESDNIYDEPRIFERSAVIAVAIDARRKHHPRKTSFQYQPFAGVEDDYRLTDETFQRVIQDYNVKDLAI